MSKTSNPTAASRWLAVGALIGLAHLTRADGLLLWIPAALIWWTSPRRRGASIVVAFAGYLIVTSLWWARNLSAFGTALPPGVGRTLWLLDYDELFLYPADVLTSARWLGAGWGAILEERLAAGWTNLQSLVAVNGYVVLLPVALYEGWSLRRHPVVRAAAAYAAVLLAVMTVVFPFAGARGGFFHSSAALMPLGWALIAMGTERLAGLAPRVKWHPERTRPLILAVAFVVAAGVSLWTLGGKAGAFGPAGSFARNEAAYRSVGMALAHQGSPTGVVAVVNPPGFFSATGIEAVALPHGSVETLRSVIERFGVRWIVLEADHPAGLADLYLENSGASGFTASTRLEDPAGRPILLIPVGAGQGD